MIALIDYGAGNLRSVEKAVHFIGEQVQIVTNPDELLHTGRAILPGVGAFGDTKNALQCSGMIQPVLDFIASGKPFLGICLGMQVLFEGSEESPGVPGLGVLKGRLKKIPDTPGLKVPHMGWNSLRLLQKDGVFQGLEGEPYVYFVHSYYLDAPNKAIVSAQTQYGAVIDAAVRWRNVYATQFHPEKSGAVGLQILRNFLSLPETEVR